MEAVLTLCENFVAHVRRFGRTRVQILLRTSVDFPADVRRKNQIINRFADKKYSRKNVNYSI
jgi:hypothetical protein